MEEIPNLEAGSLSAEEPNEDNRRKIIEGDQLAIVKSHETRVRARRIQQRLLKDRKIIRRVIGTAE